MRSDVAIRGPGDPLTRPPWAYPYYTELELSAYFEVSGSFIDDLPSCHAYVRAKPFEAYQLFQTLYNQRLPRGTNYPLWLLTRSLADYFMYGEDPEHYLSEETYQELVMGPGHLVELCIVMILDTSDGAQFFEEHPTWIRGVLELLTGIMTIYYIRHKDRLAEELDSPTMNVVRKMGCTLWGPLWTNRWLFMDGNRQEEFYPETGKELRIALCNLVFNFYQLFRTCDISLASKPKREFNEFRDYGHEDLRRLALFCWMRRCRTPSGTVWPAKFEHLYDYTSLAFLRSSPGEKIAFVHDDIVGAFGARTFLNRVSETLRRSDLQKHNTASFIEHVLLILWDIPSFAPHLDESGVLQAISTIFERQCRPLEPNDDDKAQLALKIMLCYALIATKFPLSEGARPIIRQCNAMELLGLTTTSAFVNNFPPIAKDKALPVSTAMMPSFQTDCLQVLNLFITMAEIVVTHSTAGESSDLHLTLHDALKLVWLPTHKDLVTGLRETTESSLQTQLKEAWIRLGEVVGLDLERERAEAKRDARRKETCCAWKDCRWHRVPPPNPPRVCKGCGEMRYCSKTCQTEDWKSGHKKGCRRLKS